MTVFVTETWAQQGNDVGPLPGHEAELHELWWAHEVKTMLAVVQMSLAALQRKAPPVRELAAREIDTAQASIRRATALVEGALGRPTFRLIEGEPLLVPGMLRSVASMIRSAADGRGESSGPVEVVERYDPSVPLIWGDRRLLEAAFVNLAINSLQAIGAEGGRIEFCVASTPAGLEVCVRDTGPGFARRGLPELADPALRQLAGCGGTGLGLSIVRAAVYIHGGRLHIGDIEPRGAEVGIVLPVFG